MMATSQEVKETYKSTLQDLTCNSKPLISVLTMLAEENVAHAKDITEEIEEHLAKVPTDVKLPVLYLIDCIVKNVGGPYTAAFSSNLANLFTSVFQVVDEKTRMEMFKLRQTWNEVFSKSKLYSLDLKTNQLDPAWPVTSAPPNIHFNPKFLNSTTTKLAAATPKPSESALDMQQKLLIKHKQLLELQQKKLELELLQTQVKLQEQQKKHTSSNNVPDDTTIKINHSSKLLLKPEVAKQLLNNKKDESAKAMLAQINQRFPVVANASTIPPKPVIIPPLMSNSVGTMIRPPIRDPRLIRQQAPERPLAIETTMIQPVIDITNNTSDDIKTNNKFSGRESRFDTKDQPKGKVGSRIPLKSKRSSSPSKSKSSSSSSRHTKTSGAGSTSSLDSPNKSSRSASKSPSKSTKTSYKSKSSRSNSDKRSSKRSDRRSPKKEKSQRNYRRERAISISPDPPNKTNEDNRSGPPEKQARINVDSKHDKDARKCGSVGSKKRLSSENIDGPTSKKNRSEIFDALFGSEDGNSRKADKERPITPPAPIISSKPKESIEKENTNGAKEPEVVPKLSLEVLRAKLANATNANKDHIQKSRLLAQAEQQKAKLAKMEENKIFITSVEEESIKSGKMTKAQESSLFGKVIAQIENQKIKEAKRKENEENLNSMMTQPISDDEFDSDMDAKRSEEMISMGGIVSTKQSRFEPLRFNRDPQWKGGMKHGGFPSIRGNVRGRADPWIRPMHQGTLWNPPNIGPVFEDVVDITKIDPHSMDVVVNNSPPHTALDDVCMSHENIKSINIDGEPRDILFYGETAIAFMTPEDPREISFQAGQRRVSFDDMHSYLLAFNDPYRDVLIGGHCHRVRLGAPTREIYIDGKPYECIFGGPPIAIELDRKLVMVHIEGPAPQVKIGSVKRTDLVAGKVNLIIDAKTILPIYLDARTQTFDVNGTTNTLRFKDALQTVMINELPYNLEFGGLPKGVIVNGRKHFIRFSVLPKGVRAGYCNIRDMEGTKALSDNENSQDAMDLNPREQPQVPRPRKSRFTDSSPDRNQSSILNLLQQPSFGNLDSLLSIASSVLPTIHTHNMSNYQIEQPPPPICPPMIDPVSQLPQLPPSNPQMPPINTTVPPPITVQPPPAINNSVLNINDLFQKLVATGIVTSLQNPPPSSQPGPVKSEGSRVASPLIPPHEVDIAPKPNKFEVQIKPISFDDTSSLKVRQPALILELYAGMQCSSCGMRFAQENSSLYSQHLDWHFRQNRKGKKNIRKASSRRWYYTIADWSNYEEIEDLEEREKCYFENQQRDHPDGQNDDHDGDFEIPSVPTDSNVQDARCEVCQEKFEQFYNEEKEEWHLRMAIRIEEEDKTYHPLCYEDYQASLVDESCDKSTILPDVDMKEEPKTIPGLDVDADEPTLIIDFDSAGSRSNTPQVGVEVTDDVKSETKTETLVDAPEEKDDAESMDAEDDDVVINEVEPEKIVLDDYEFDENGLIAGVVVKQEPIDDGFTDIENFHLGTPERKKEEEQEEDTTPQDEAFADIGVISEPAEPESSPDKEKEPVMAPPTEEAIEQLENSENHSAPATLSINEPLLAMPTIDGNLDCNAGVVPLPTGGMSGKIKINISKPLPVIAPKENKDTTSDVDNNIEPIDPTQPLPPGEEPVHLHLKPALQGIDLKQLPPVNKGSELTGLCSIM